MLSSLHKFKCKLRHIFVQFIQITIYEVVEVQITKDELEDIIQKGVEKALRKLVKKGVIGGADKGNTVTLVKEKSTYQQTEALLFNYNNFKKIIKQKEQEIEDIRKYGVLEGGGAVKQYGGSVGGKPQGIVLDEEKIERAVERIEKSMETPVQAIELIDKGMAALANDPYYRILEMRYFEGRTLEDIATDYRCTQPNITYHRSRLVKELSIQLFPDKVASECMY